MKEFFKSSNAAAISVAALLGVSPITNAASAATGTSPGPSISARPPVYFEPHTDDAGRVNGFFARGHQYTISLTPGEATLILDGSSRAVAASPARRFQERSHEHEVSARAVRLRLEGANPSADIAGIEPLTGKANYLIGNDSAAWKTGVPLYAKVQVEDVYPGISVVYYVNPSAQLEYDFVVQPQSDPGKILLRIEGADAVRVDRSGHLVLKSGSHWIRQPRPILYQEVGGKRKPVEGGYRIAANGAIGFRVGTYDPSLPLVIDPILEFSTYLGGRRADIGWSIAVDPNGNVYVAGESLSRELATTAGSLQPAYGGGVAAFGDAFVAKFDNTGTNLVYLTYLGGRASDSAFAVAADADGFAYVTGFTHSRNFPVTNATLRTELTGLNNNAFRLFPIDAFVAKLDPTGSSLAFSTLLGGARRDAGVGIAVDASGIYVAGLTESDDFVPAPNGVQTDFGGRADVFVTKLIDGSNYVFSTYLGGVNLDYAESLAVSGGEPVVTGFTFSPDFPTTNVLVIGGAALTNINGTAASFRTDAFVSRLSADGSALVFSSFLGGNNDDAGLDVTTDAAGNAYVTGYTSSRNFPTNTTPQSGPANFQSHVFVTKIGPLGGTDVPYSVQFGGNRNDRGAGIAVDAAGNAYVAGSTTSTNFFAGPVFTDFRALSSTPIKRRRALSDAFVAVLSPDGSSFVSTNSVYFGGTANDQAHDIALDPTGSAVWIAGQTTSRDLPLTNAVQSTLGNVPRSRLSDAFIGKIVFP